MRGPGRRPAGRCWTRRACSRSRRRRRRRARSTGGWRSVSAAARAEARLMLLEHRDPDHADVLPAAAAGRVAVADVGEAKRRDLLERLAKALDRHRTVGLDHVAALGLVVAELAGDHVAPVDRHHSLDPLAGVVLQPQVVAPAVVAGDVHRTIVPVGVDDAALGALERHRHLLRRDRLRLVVVTAVVPRPVGVRHRGPTREHGRAQQQGRQQTKGGGLLESSHGQGLRSAGLAGCWQNERRARGASYTTTKTPWGNPRAGLSAPPRALA